MVGNPLTFIMPSFCAFFTIPAKYSCLTLFKSFDIFTIFVSVLVKKVLNALFIIVGSGLVTFGFFFNEIPKNFLAPT